VQRLRGHEHRIETVGARLIRLVSGVGVRIRHRTD
jgi:hypothetical protein